MAEKAQARSAIRVWLIASIRFSLVLVFLVTFLIPHSVFAENTLEHEMFNTISEYGFSPPSQVFCAEQNGVLLASFQDALPAIPASVAKLYVTDWALSMYSPEYRFTTKVYYSKGVLSIMGGSDPELSEADLKVIFSRLTKTEKSSLTTIVFDRNVIVNWQTSPTLIGTTIATNAKAYFKRTIKVRYRPLVVPLSKVRLTLSSSPLLTLLKEMNNYSNNVIADTLFAKLGGKEALHKYLLTTYGSMGNDASFDTGSGTHDTTTSCRLTLSVLKHIEKKLVALGKTLPDVLVVPTIDSGTVHNRFLGIGPSLVVKTGYVFHAQTAAGVMNTTNGSLYFAIFTSNIVNPYIPGGRQLVDELTADIAKTVTLIPYKYSVNQRSSQSQRTIR